MRAPLATLVAATLLCGCSATRPSSSPAPDRAVGRGDSVAAFVAAADNAFARAAAQFSEVPGFAVAVVRGDSVVYLRGFGVADRETGAPVTPGTAFYIASVTKPFTALAAALLDAQGRLDLDDPLTRHTPGVAFDPALHADSVTLRDLLTHTAGLANGPLVNRLAYTGEHTPEVLWSLLATTRPSAAPRGTFRYTNLGYNLLQLVLDREVGQPWQAVLRELVLDPVAMTRTTPYASRVEREGWAAATPYVAFGPAGLEPAALRKTDATMHAAGGLFSTAADLARWLEVQLNDGRLDGRQVFPPNVVAATHRPLVAVSGSGPGPISVNAYGLGWRFGALDGRPVIHHGGGYPGAHALVSFDPASRVGVAVLANEENAAQLLAALVSDFAYDWWSGEADAAVTFGRQVEEARAFVTEYVGHLAAERARRAERAWQLTAPLAAYAGTYRSPLYGTLIVTIQGDAPAFRMGNLRAVGTPYTEPNAVRVELVPGEGEVVRFEVDEGGRVVGLRYGDVPFERQE